VKLFKDDTDLEVALSDICDCDRSYVIDYRVPGQMYALVDASKMDLDARMGRFANHGTGRKANARFISRMANSSSNLQRTWMLCVRSL
jgi:hypothetical protein